MSRSVASLKARAAAARRRWLPLALPAPQAGIGFSRAAIEYVLSALEVKRPVEIQWSTDLRSETTTGSCQWMPDGRHLIKVRPDRSADEVNRSVLHEIVHAAQSEAYGSFEAWRDAYKRAAGVSADPKIRYVLNAFEREARAIAAEFADDFRLAVGA